MSALRQSRFVRVVAVLSVIAVLVLAVNVASAATMWNQGFEFSTGGWFDNTSDPGTGYGNMARVASGTGGIVSSAGSHHALVTGIHNESGPFSRFDGYRSAWPGDWTAEIDVYLDPAWPAGVGFDYAVAATGTDGAHQRDFIFHVAKDTSTGKLLVAGSNNSGFQVREDLETLNHAEVTSAGWYTLQHVFRNNAGVLAVDLKLLNAGGTVLLTETRTAPADTIPAEVGGNRYAWFTFVSDGLTIPADDHRLCLGTTSCDPMTVLVVAPTTATTPVPTNVCVGGVLTLWTRGWSTCDENSAGTTGYVELISGPATPPAGIGSANFVTAGPANGPAIFNAFEPGLPLANLLKINYSTRSPATEQPNFFINVDYDLADASQAWQGRLTWVPSLPGCATLAANTWQTLDPFATPDAACWFQTGNPVVGGVAGAPLYPLNGAAGSWNQIMAAYPAAGIHSSMGAIGFKVGSGSSAQTIALDKLVIGYNTGGDRYVTWDFEPGAELTTTATPATACATNQVKIDLSKVPAAYGYEFVVDYDPTLVTPTAAFASSLFDPAKGSSPLGWAAQCASGKCKFALTLQNPAPAVSGSGTVATIDLVAKKAGTFNLLVHDMQLSDEDGTAIAVKMPTTPLSIGVCGTATISGRVSLQGRVTPMDTGTVTLTPKAGGAPVSAPFNALDGSYSLTVLYPPGGATFVLQASHLLYLSNRKDLTVSGTAITGQNTRLLGGDANNSTVVDISDLGCIGGDFGLTTTSTPAMGTCGGAGSPDINLDLKVNIQDLSLAGGNYDKVAPQGW